MLTETIENQNYLTELIYIILINNTIARGLNSEILTTWINIKHRHSDLDGHEPIKKGLINVFKPLKIDNDNNKLSDRNSVKDMV